MSVEPDLWTPHTAKIVIYGEAPFPEVSIPDIWEHLGPNQLQNLVEFTILSAYVKNQTNQMGSATIMKTIGELLTYHLFFGGKKEN